MEFLTWLINNPSIIFLLIDMLIALHFVWKKEMNWEVYWLALAIIEAIFYAKNNLNLTIYFE